jgi:hypothetical protein
VNLQTVLRMVSIILVIEQQDVVLCLIKPDDQGGKTCKSSYFTTSCAAKGVSICPPAEAGKPGRGYTYTLPADPCKDAKLCGLISGGDFSYPLWQLNDACIGNEPKMDENKKVLCCTGHPPGGDYYGNCATGYFPNNSTCAGVMSDYCVKNGLNPYCKNFFNVSTNITSKNIVTQAMMDQWIKDSPDPLENQNINDMTTLCSRLASPGACNQRLYTFCNSLTRKELNENSNLKNLCGCFLNEKEYDEFKRILKGAGALTDICDPLCASSQTQRGDQN